MRCDRCGNETRGHREGGVEYCNACGGELRNEGKTDVAIPPEEPAAGAIAVEPGHVRPAVAAGPGPSWGDARPIGAGSIGWKVMRSGFYWAGRDGAVKYVVTWNDPIQDDYHVRSSVGTSPYLKTHPDEAAQVVADLERWLRDSGAYVPRTRSIFGRCEAEPTERPARARAR